MDKQFHVPVRYLCIRYNHPPMGTRGRLQNIFYEHIQGVEHSGRITKQLVNQAIFTPGILTIISTTLTWFKSLLSWSDWGLLS